MNDENNISKDVESHLKENRSSYKKKIDFKSLFTYIAMVLITIGCIVFIYFFLDQNGINIFKKEEVTTTTTEGIKTIATTSSTTGEANTLTTKDPNQSGSNYNIVIYGPSGVFKTFESVKPGEKKSIKTNIPKGEYRLGSAVGRVLFTTSQDISNATVSCMINISNNVVECAFTT